MAYKTSYRQTIKCSVIDELTPNTGVSLDGITLKDGSVNFTTSVSNPGNSNTLWQRTSDGKLFRGLNDLENLGDVVGPSSALNNAIPRFDSITGKLLKNTNGFTCDDNFNVKIGESTSLVDRQLHIQGRRDVSFFIEADTDNVDDADTPQMIMQMDANNSYGSIGLLDTNLPAGGLNTLVLQHSNTNPAETEGILFRTGGVHTITPIGTPVTSFTTTPINAMQIRPNDQKVTTFTGLITNLIEERSAANGVTVDSVNLKDGSINLLTAATNPGGANTLWQRTSDGHILRGVIDLETVSGDVFGPASATDNAIPRFDTITGKLIQNSGVVLDDLQNMTNVNSITVDTITENTLNNGVNIELTNIKDGRINLPDSLNADTGVISFNNTKYIHNYGPTNTNLFIGRDSGNFTNTGSRNTTVGQDTLFQLTTGNDCVAIGESSQLFNETGVRNVNVGNSSNGNNVNGNNNTSLGHLSLESNEGSSNIGIGNGAGASFTTGNNNIAIANNGQAGVSNKIYIGNTSHNDTKLYGIYGSTIANTVDSYLVGVDLNHQLTRGSIGIGELSFEDFTTPFLHVTPVINTFYEVTPVMTLLTNQSTKFSTLANGRIQWNGSFSSYFNITISLCAESTTLDDTCSIEIYKNGVKIPNTQNRQKYTNTTDWITTSYGTLVELTTNDYISIFIANNISTTGLNIGNMNIKLIMS